MSEIVKLKSVDDEYLLVTIKVSGDELESGMVFTSAKEANEKESRYAKLSTENYRLKERLKVVKNPDEAVMITPSEFESACDKVLEYNHGSILELKRLLFSNIN